MDDTGTKAYGWKLAGVVGYSARRMLAGAVDLVFPATCPSCGRMIARHGALCEACWCDIAFIERPYCEVLGIPFSHDLGPGIVSAEAIANPPDFGRLRSACRFDGAARRLVHRLKYNDRTELAPMMAAWMVRAGADILGECDAVLPVPLHVYRAMARKYNQAGELARAVAAEAGKPLLPAVLRRKRNTHQQVGLGRTAREDNVRGAFEITARGKVEIPGRRIVVIDDVYTTGATVSAVSRLLLRAGAADVSVLTFARALPDII
jgi:ComF family protein